MVQQWIDQAISSIIANSTNNHNHAFAPQVSSQSPSSFIGSFIGNNATFTDFNEQFNYNIFPFPVKGFSTDRFWSDFGALFFFFVLIQFVYPINVIVTVLVNEKADKIAEGLKMMGATLASYWVSWIVWFFCESAIVSFLIAIAGKVFNVFKFSDMGVIFMFFWGLTLSLSSLGMMISTMFDNPKIASLFAGVIWIVLLIMGGFGRLMDETGKGWFCLLSPACVNVALNNLSNYEQALLGVQWDNVNETFGDFKFSTAIIMFYVDYVLYLVLALYFDKVWPSRYGSRLPPYFCFLKSFWQKTDYDKADPLQDKELMTMMNTSAYEDVSEKYEGTDPSIAVRHLRKYFEPLFGSGTTVKAVDGISLNMYEGEVFCLLGHNGAGKTTTIGMLTGLLDVTQGDAEILGTSIRANMPLCRKYMGVCPQHDVLFPLLVCIFIFIHP